ncbi:hypothetical protein BHYA_0289g00110 [Botrytis hyacinthi]|uniref:Uncharacterized protein n=1 Tax=Botrytis hyacinthi TaxID=278943 RepID=A0A4Z1G7C0_9HELO|nr:hypothetical protein BHYA_0289g00110 [Botrytis hyacinthi]
MCSDFSYADMEPTCPLRGFSELKAWSSWVIRSGPELTTGNLIYEPLSNTNRQLASSVLQDWSHSYTSSVSLFPYIALQSLWTTITPLNLPGHSVSQPKLSSQAATPILRPFVQVKCNIYESDTDSIATGNWRPGSDITFSLISSLTSHNLAMHGDVNTITISGLDFGNFEEENNIHMAWVNLHDFSNSGSIGAILKLPNNKNGIGHSHIVPCTVDARWISAELSIEPATSQSVFNANGSRSSDLASVASDMIKIGFEWAQLMSLVTPIDHKYPSSLDMPTNSTIYMPNATSIEVLLKQRLLYNGWLPNTSTSFDAPDLFNASTRQTMIQAFISIFLGILIADSLARYGIISSTTRLALATLLTHTPMTLIFIVYLCFAGWTTKSWGSIGGLVALALISRRTKGFRGTDAGISRAETWAQNVRIVEAGDGGLKMRFEEDGEGEGIKMGKRVQVGKKYGYQKVAVKANKRGKTFASMP